MSDLSVPRARPRLAALATVRPRLTLEGLWLFLGVALPILGASLASLSTVDLAYAVRLGQEALTTGRVPSVDHFTFTAAGRTWLDQQWGAQVTLAAIYDLGGWLGLALGRTLLVGVIAAAMLAAARRQGAGPRTAAMLALASFVLAAPAMAMRAQLLAMTLFALAVLLVSGRRQHPRTVWLLPLLVGIWANVHGTFVVGVGLAGYAWLEDVARGEAWRRSLVVLAGCLLATAVTPFGPSVWVYAVGITTSPLVTQFIAEWRRTSPLTPLGAAFYASLAVVVALVAWRLRARGRTMLRGEWPALLWLAGLALLGAYAERGVAWWALGAPPLLARILAGVGAAAPRSTHHEGQVPADARGRPERSTSGATALNGWLAVALLVGIVAAQPAWRAGSDPARPDYLSEAPAGITAALRTTTPPGARIFQPQVWGSWFELALPDRTYFADARFDVEPEQVYLDYLAISSGAPDWSRLLDHYGATVVVADPTLQAGLLPRLAADPAWRRAYADRDGVIYVRAGG